MKKIIIGGVALVVIAGGILGIGKLYTNATGANAVLEEKYSSAINEIAAEGIDYSEYYSDEGDMEQVIENAEEEIAEVGENIAITEEEVNQYEAFYELQGEKDAEEKALSYAEERNALYVKAIENGYDVTDEEVYAYLDELKAMLQEENNQEMYHSAMEGFESEEDYWAYEFTVYKVDCICSDY